MFKCVIYISCFWTTYKLDIHVCIACCQYHRRKIRYIKNVFYLLNNKCQKTVSERDTYFIWFNLYQSGEWPSASMHSLYIIYRVECKSNVPVGCPKVVLVDSSNYIYMQ